jgi:hypothetical protein
MRQWAYALSCVVVPVLWGLGVVWVTNRIEGFMHRPTPTNPDGTPPPPLEFHI